MKLLIYLVAVHLHVRRCMYLLCKNFYHSTRYNAEPFLQRRPTLRGGKLKDRQPTYAIKSGKLIGDQRIATEVNYKCKRAAMWIDWWPYNGTI